MGVIWFFIDLFLNIVYLIRVFLLLSVYLSIFMLAFCLFPISLPWSISKHKQMMKNYEESKRKYIDFVKTLEIGERRGEILRKIKKFKRRDCKGLSIRPSFYSSSQVEIVDRFFTNQCVVYKVNFKFKRGKLYSMNGGEYNRTTTTTYH